MNCIYQINSHILPLFSYIHCCLVYQLLSPQSHLLLRIYYQLLYILQVIRCYYGYRLVVVVISYYLQCPLLWICQMIPLLYLLLHRMPILQYTLSIQLILSLVDCLLLQRHLFNLEIRLFRYIEVTLNTTHCILLLSRCVIE